MGLVLFRGPRKRSNNLMFWLENTWLHATCSHYSHSSVERLYLPRSNAGRGLINIENLYNRKLVFIAHHLLSSTDKLVQLCSTLDHSLPPRVSIITRAKNYCSSISLPSDLTSFSSATLRCAISDKQSSSLVQRLVAKPLHGKFFSLLASCDIHKGKSTRWLYQHLHSESESTIFAIQDQVIATRVYEAKVMMKNVPSVMCRVCGQAEETILHLLSACPQLAAKLF